MKNQKNIDLDKLSAKYSKKINLNKIKGGNASVYGGIVITVADIF